MSFLWLFRVLYRPRARTFLVRISLAALSVVCVLMMLSGRQKMLHTSHDDSQGDPVSSKRVLPLDLMAQFEQLNPVNESWGRNGAAVILKDKKARELDKKSFKQAAFSVYISDRISPNRSLPQVRPKECDNVTYDVNKLGTTSVIIIFTDEIWSALIRTVWSVMNRTPSAMLEQVILVDDASTRSELKSLLDQYMDYYFGNKVIVIRTGTRVGLIKARLLGAKAAKGDILLFLDSHCECTTGWLEPLAYRIRADPTTVMCPVIDVINDRTLEYSMGDPYYFQVGGFNWGGHFTWIDIPDKEIKRDPTKAQESPTMAGGLFAIDRKFFWKIGSYDNKMEIWGGENLEMSFRIWMCGGSLLIHPCSHVGHIFRDYHPYSFLGKDTHGFNTLRTVLVWMEPKHQSYFFMHRQDLHNKNAGNLIARNKLRSSLECKSFTWYLDHVYKGKKFMYDHHVQGYGFVKNNRTNLCLDTLNNSEESKFHLGLYTCENPAIDSYTNQMMSLTHEGALRREEVCARPDDQESMVYMARCSGDVLSDRPLVHQIPSFQVWIHSPHGNIQNKMTRKCISVKGKDSSDSVSMEPCDPHDGNQLFSFQQYPPQWT